MLDNMLGEHLGKIDWSHSGKELTVTDITIKYFFNSIKAHNPIQINFCIWYEEYRHANL